MISVIIPTYGNSARLTTLLKSIRKYEQEGSYEVIIVNDNPDADSIIRKQFPREKVISNKVNSGFARSVNAGMREAKGEILLLLNDDIVLFQPVLSKVATTFTSDPSIGITGALLRYPDKRIQHGGMIFDERNKSFLHVKNENQATSRYIIAVTGAFFAILKACYQKLGGLDESFFLACEDTKYCLDAWKNNFKVYFSKEIQAFHLEGATRGVTTAQKSKFPRWTQEERAGVQRFKVNLETSFVKKLIKDIKKLNKVKIEVGSGFNPHPGYLHLDVRAGLPQLDYICDFTQQRLPFEEGEVTEILANHVIEHIPFRKLPFVVGEWARVLQDGGKLVLRTPDLEFICKSYLAGKITPEWPGDEKFIKENLSEEITPSWWANLKLFSGQDYAANFHHCCFDFSMLRDFLRRFGFGVVDRVKFDKEFSPGELQIEAVKSISKEKSCVVIREGAIGDVLLTTPIIERLAKEYKNIDVYTQCGEVFKNNPHIRAIYPITAKLRLDYDKQVNLNLAYERTPKMHIVDAYSKVAFSDTLTPHKPKLYEPEEKKEDYIVIHRGKSWPNRTWPTESWNKLEHLLINVSGLYCIESQMDFWKMVSIIKKAKLFIGMDSGPLHIAQAVGTMCVGLFTCAKAEYRVTNKTLAITPEIDCYGCLHEEKPPVTYCGCKRGDFKCLDLITPEIVFETVKSYL